MKIVDYRVYQEFDADASPLDCDCYSADSIEAWKHNKWHYIGVIVTEIREDEDGYECEGESASLWGVESNSSREYFDSIIEELTDDLKASRNTGN